VIYNQVLWDPYRPSHSSKTINNFYDKELNESFLLSSRKANGNVSIQAKRKLSKAIEYLITTATEKKVHERLTGKTVTFKIAFITLTLPSKQQHPDTEIINTCLNSFIIEIKKYYHVKNYVWRAEKQKNGNIHFHLIIDKFIPWSELRDRWNRIINKLGYVTRYQEFLKTWHNAGFKLRKDLLKNWDEQAQRLAYQKGKTNDFANPNSTDIHSTKKIRNIKKYLTKYLTKNEQPENNQLTNNAPHAKQTGRIWGCNHELSNIEGFKAEIDSEIADELRTILSTQKVHVYSTTYFSVYYLDYHDLKKLGANQLFKYFANYLYDEFGFNEQLKIAV